LIFFYNASFYKTAFFSPALILRRAARTCDMHDSVYLWKRVGVATQIFAQILAHFEFQIEQIFEQKNEQRAGSVSVFQVLSVFRHD